MVRHNINNDRQSETGLLTRCVPQKLKHSAIYGWFLRLTRLFQFLSAAISLGMFSSRMYKVYRLVKSFQTHYSVSRSYGAIEGILAAAVLYTLIATLVSCIKKNSIGGGPSWMGWLWVLLDLAFVAAFIAVAVLTSPNGGVAGPSHCYNVKGSNGLPGKKSKNSMDQSCNLPWGVFILAILSTLLHAITASFHQVRDHHRKSRRRSDEEEKAIRQGHAEDNGRWQGREMSPTTSPAQGYR